MEILKRNQERINKIKEKESQAEKEELELINYVKSKCPPEYIVKTNCGGSQICIIDQKKVRYHTLIIQYLTPDNIDISINHALDIIQR